MTTPQQGEAAVRPKKEARERSEPQMTSTRTTTTRTDYSRAWVALAAALASSLLVGLAASSARASTTFVVNDTGDAPDAAEFSAPEKVAAS
jgi:hypothetical protein